MIAALVLAYALFVYYLAYVAIMAAQRSGALAKLRWYARAACWSVALPAGLLDVAFNVTVGSAIFLEPPRELLFTTRCERHMNRQNWRGRLARWVCESWLNPFQANHCH
jgi:hypothetical protein